MVKRFISFGLALLLSFSFLFYLPNEKVSAYHSEIPSFDGSYYEYLSSPSHLTLLENEFSSLGINSDDYYYFIFISQYDVVRYIYFLKSDFLSFEITDTSHIFNCNSNSVTSKLTGNDPSSSDYCRIFIDFSSSSNSWIYCWKYSSSSSGSSSSILFKSFITNFSSSGEPAPSLDFSLSPELCLDMDLDSVQNSLTVSVENSTEKAYDYMLYVSSTPAATSLTSSLYNMNFASSSKQWCYTKQSDSSVPPDLQQLIKDNASDTFTTSTIIDTLYPGSTGVLFNVWGSQFKAYSEYLSYKEDHITFYSLSQTNCPIYLINREDSRSHVIPFSSFNIEMGKTYYFNIIYREHDQTVVGALGTSTTALLAAGNGQYSYPVFDTSQFTSYQNYSSTEFSVTNGIVSNPQKDDLTDFHSVAYYSNPDNSTAYITNDNSVNINNSFNSGSGSGDGGYDPSCSTNYINHGVIYHGCTIYNSPSGSGSGSGSSCSVPDLPEFEFTELYEKSGGFFDFVKLVIENSGWIPVTIFSSLCLVVLFCRIWGR